MMQPSMLRIICHRVGGAVCRDGANDWGQARWSSDDIIFVVLLLLFYNYHLFIIIISVPRRRTPTAWHGLMSVALRCHLLSHSLTHSSEGYFQPTLYAPKVKKKTGTLASSGLVKAQWSAWWSWLTPVYPPMPCCNTMHHTMQQCHHSISMQHAPYHAAYETVYHALCHAAYHAAMPCSMLCSIPCSMVCSMPCTMPCTMPCHAPMPCTMPCTMPCSQPCTMPCSIPCSNAMHHAMHHAMQHAMKQSMQHAMQQCHAAMPCSNAMQPCHAAYHWSHPRNTRCTLFQCMFATGRPDEAKHANLSSIQFPGPFVITNIS